jgi:hypothetical protein
MNEDPTSQQLNLAKTKALEAILGESISDLGKDVVISEFFKKRIGLPIQTALLKRTKEELRNMPEHEKEWLLDAVHKKIRVLQDYCDDQRNWILLGDDYLVSFIPLEQLP